MPTLPTSIGTLTALGPEGAAEAGVAFSVQLVEGDGEAGFGISRAVVTKTTNGSGVATFTLIRGKRYRIWRQASPEIAVPFTVPDAATFDLPEVLGSI